MSAKLGMRSAEKPQNRTRFIAPGEDRQAGRQAQGSRSGARALCALEQLLGALTTVGIPRVVEAIRGQAVPPMLMTDESACAERPSDQAERRPLTEIRLGTEEVAARPTPTQRLNDLGPLRGAMRGPGSPGSSNPHGCDRSSPIVVARVAHGTALQAGGHRFRSPARSILREAAATAHLEYSFLLIRDLNSATRRLSRARRPRSAPCRSSARAPARARRSPAA